MVTVVGQQKLTNFDKYASYEEPDNGGIIPMSKEVNRLRTYRNWPCKYMKPESLAKAGFYYMNIEDIVRCAFCNIEIGQWEQGDNAMVDHQRWSENCPFIRGHSCGNIPIETDSVPISSSEGQDTCGKYGVEVRPNSMPETSTSNVAKEFDFHTLGLPPYRGPIYTEYVTLDRRLNSFASWPRSIKQRPNELAAAGFFYNGKGDQTICFHCGGGLKDWEDKDVPWEQHAKWFPKCNFVWLQKGPEYISGICNKQSAVLTPTETAELETSVKTDRNINAENPELDIHNQPSASKSASSPNLTQTKELVSNNDDDDAANKNLCKICYVKERGVLFFPCRHMVACIDCAPALSTCVICREPFQAVTRVFLP